MPPSPPRLTGQEAVFLDLDGTLLAIAQRPDAVRVPESLLKALSRVSARHGGAVALISGRALVEVDSLFAPTRLPVAGPSKGNAICAFLAELPFAGRTPVFAGDDLTD